MLRKKKCYSNNKTGHKFIQFTRYKKTDRYLYRVQKKINGKYKGIKHFENKIDAICYKFIMLLKIKSNIK